jgi:hypothetical protein
LVDYKSLLSVLVTVQSKSRSQAAADASSYITLCYSLICPEKAKQELEPLGGLSLSYKTRTKDRIDKGLVYPM